jgi:hypothetical protein
MKAREPRLTCVIKARMRLHGVWRDVCIRNISSRGMLIQAASAPPRGTYVEVYRGRHVIVARVAWSKDHRFGVHTQDRLNLDALLQEPDASGINYKDKLKAEPAFERRATPRPRQADLRWRAERSRFFSKALEFACVGATGAAAALLVFDTASGVLARPVAAVTAELSK